jgi:hypothetical protein
LPKNNKLKCFMSRTKIILFRNILLSPEMKLK